VEAINDLIRTGYFCNRRKGNDRNQYFVKYRRVADMRFLALPAYGKAINFYRENECGIRKTYQVNCLFPED